MMYSLSGSREGIFVLHSYHNTQNIYAIFINIGSGYHFNIRFTLTLKVKLKVKVTSITSVKSTFTSVKIKNYVKLSIAIVRFVEKIEVFIKIFFMN